jgi:hypothetical protein
MFSPETAESRLFKFAESVFADDRKVGLGLLLAVAFIAATILSAL